ncbi:MAG TPA: Imm39 family immunity protein [Acidobacteriota bacterium]|nr:Imm39 family immunity protein [Acidobacteriota bacterium]
MIKKPPHNRKLGIVGIALTKAMNNPREIEALTLVRDEVEKVITESGYLEGAPFSWVTLAIRYGLKNEPEPTYQKINQRYGDLPLAIEVDTHELLDSPLQQLKNVFKWAALRSLIDAGRKYARPTRELEAELALLESDS